MPLSPRIELIPIFEADIVELVQLYVDNRSYTEPFEPIRAQRYYSVEGQAELLAAARENHTNDKAYTFAIRDKATSRLLGRIGLSNVSRGAWQSCTVGYFVSQAYTGQGVATEALDRIVQLAFEEFHLHRIQAAIMPRNLASIRVVEKIGFQYEGLSKFYLNIHGIWEDHKIYSLTKEMWPNPKRGDK